MEDKNADNMENKSEKECCCHSSKHRSEKEYKDMMNRLNRIEGQVRGVKGDGRKGRLLSGDSGTGISGECGTEQL